MSADEILKPCPFCGGEAQFNDTSSTWVRCEDCGAETQCQLEKKDAAQLWNRRHNICGDENSNVARLREALAPFTFSKSTMNFERFDDGNTAWVAVDGAGSDRVCFFVGDIIRARAAFSTQVDQAPQQGWQPIKTAPKDGTKILLSCPAVKGYPGVVEKCFWWPAGKKWWDWVCPDKPTHWMPIPAPVEVPSNA